MPQLRYHRTLDDKLSFLGDLAQAERLDPGGHPDRVRQIVAFGIAIRDHRVLDAARAVLRPYLEDTATD